MGFGQITFQKTYGGSNQDVGSSVQQTTDGGYIIAGGTYGINASSYFDVYLIKTNAVGDTLWKKNLGGIYDSEAKDVHQTIDGGYIIAGYTNGYGAGNYDIYLIKTNSAEHCCGQKPMEEQMMIRVIPFSKLLIEDILLQDI